MEKISVDYLINNDACKKPLHWFEDVFGNSMEYTPEELMAIAYNLDLNPGLMTIRWIITHNESCHTKEALNYFKFIVSKTTSEKEIEQNIRQLITFCEYCQTKEMIEYYKSFNPSDQNVLLLITYCDYCKVPEIKKILTKR